jgi:two-component system, chemotaxis family, CheB/CheR fusion protein
MQYRKEPPLIAALYWGRPSVGFAGLGVAVDLENVNNAFPYYRIAVPFLDGLMITGNADVSMAVRAMKAGASDFIEKPINPNELVVSVERALEQSRDSNKLLAWREAAAKHVASLTQRQRQVMESVLAGKPNKIVAADLGISQRTVENHRASIMKKTGSKSLPALARLALAAGAG